MATEATFTVPSDQFPLGTVFNQLSDVTVTLERLIPARDVVIPYFWVRGTEIDDVEGVFTEHPGVRAIRVVESVDDDYLLCVEWAPDYENLLTVLTETGVTLIEATGTTQQWTFEIRGDTRSDIADFHDRCRELDIPLTLTKLHALTPIETANDSDDFDPEDDPSDLDTALALCQDRRCRIVLGTLAAEQRPVSLTDLTETIYKHTHQTPLAEASEDLLTEIRLSVYHSHLPKLASKGFVQYNPKGHLAEPTEKLEKMERTLTAILDADPSLEAPIEL